MREKPDLPASLPHDPASSDIQLRFNQLFEFHGREILVSVSRSGLARLAEAPARPQAEGAA